MPYPQDPFILLSLVNTLLRDEYPSLSELCAARDYPEAEITEKLREAGFAYDAELNRFR